MTTIEAHAPYATLINVFTVEPERAHGRGVQRLDFNLVNVVREAITLDAGERRCRRCQGEESARPDRGQNERTQGMACHGGNKTAVKVES